MTVSRSPRRSGIARAPRGAFFLNGARSTKRNGRAGSTAAPLRQPAARGLLLALALLAPLAASAQFRAGGSPPVAEDDAFATTDGVAVFVDVLDNDSDADGDDLSITSVTDPANGTAEISFGGAIDGTFDGVRYTPTAGFTGTDTFSYTINDGTGNEDTATVTVTVSATPAELTIRSLHPANNGAFSAALAGLADVDGDGRGDLLIGAPAEELDDLRNAGAAYVYSGATGALIYELTNPDPVASDLFGLAVAAVPDTDGDGVDDFIVGTDRQDVVYLYSGATGAILLTIDPDVSIQEMAIAGVPDADGDGRGDVLIGNTLAGPPSRAGAAYLFSGATGELLTTVMAPTPVRNAFFGNSVAGVPDADGDGRGDLLVGARREAVGGVSFVGRAYLFSGATGAILYELEASDTSDTGFFGESVAGLADLNGDGRGDFLVSTTHEDVDGLDDAGRVYVFSGATGDTLRTLVSPEAERFGYFGRSSAAVPDANNDGVDDILVGANGESNGGAAYLFSGADGTLLRAASTLNPFTGGGFGDAVAGLPDATGDGRGDILVSAVDETTSSTIARDGRAYRFSGVAPGANAPPAPEDDDASTLVNTAVLIDVLANDSDPDGDDLSITSVDDPDDGTVAIEGGQLRYTPDPDFTGTDSFFYVVSDGKLTASANVFVTVRADNRYLDPTFGDGGLVVTDFEESFDRAYAASLLPDGRIAVGGTSNDAFALAVYTADGTLDASFGDGGLVRSPSVGDDTEINGLAARGDGSILAVGTERIGGKKTARGADVRIVAARYTASGALDTSFGDSGSFTSTYEGRRTSGEAVALLDDGSFLVAGTATNAGSHTDFALSRYTASGMLDTSFGDEGFAVVDPSGGDDDEATALAVQADGAILLAGGTPNEDGVVTLALYRFLADGSIDDSFGTGGLTTSMQVYGSHVGLAVQDDGAIVVSGYQPTKADDDFVVARFTPSGDPDTSFGSGGVTIADFDLRRDGSTTLAIQTNGAIVAAGVSEDNDFIGDFALARFTPSGDPDLSFGDEGVILTDFGGDDTGEALVLDADGNAILAGTADAVGPPAFAVARYLTAGGGGNTPPVAENDTATTDEGESVLINVLANDTDPDGDGLAVTSIEDPANGTAVEESSDIRYTPDAGFTGEDTFTYTISDGNGGTASATVTVTVRETFSGITVVSGNPQAGGQFGSAVSVTFDANGDGRMDLVVGAFNENTMPGRGRVYLFDGVSGDLLQTMQSPSDQAGFFGSAVSGIQDVDGDGRGDVLTGAYFETDEETNDGRAYLFSGSSGALLRTFVSPDGSRQGNFGWAVSGVPDTNGDDVADVLISAQREDGGAADAGKAYLFSGATGDLLLTLESPNPEENGQFGASVMGLGDVDGDDRGDVLIGASEEDGGATDAGRAYLFSGATGALLQTMESPNPTERGLFGHSVTAGDDLDSGDGFGLLIGAHGESGGGDGRPGLSPGGISGAGRAYLFSAATGDLVRTLESPNVEVDGQFGESVSIVPDADGDGQTDLLVGANQEDGGATDAGRAYLFSGATGSLLSTLESPNGEENGQFGSAVTGVLDTDGDGRGELFAGAPREAGAEGRAYLFSGAVEPGNRPPEARDDEATTDEDASILIDVLANDTDPDGDGLAVASVTDPANGTAEVEGGQVRYTPDAGFSGEDSFTYTADDGEGGTDDATVTITVTEAPNNPPVAVDDTATAPVGSSILIDVLANDSDPDGDALTLDSVTDPAGGVAAIEGGQIRYTTGTGFTGTDSFTYTLSDPDGETDTATVTVTVTTFSATTSVRAGGTVGAPLTIGATPSGFTPTSGTLSYRAGGALTYTSVALEPGDLTATIPAREATTRGLEYYVTLQGSGVEITVPETTPDANPIHLRLLLDDVASLAAPPADGTYRMVSIPASLEDASVEAIFGDDYGAYGPTTWRALRWNPETETYDEAASLGDLTPGVGVWLATLRESAFDVDDGLTSAPDDATITLQPGWNQIGTPFAFPISWDAVEGSAEAGSLARWDGVEYLFDAETLEPWTGYFVLNDTAAPLDLVVPYRSVLTRPAAKTSPYSLRLLAEDARRGLRDTQTRLAFLHEDRQPDAFEPPPVTDGLHVSAIREDGRRLAVSHRVDEGEGAAWTLEVSAPASLLREGEVSASLSTLESGARPDGYRVFVFDAATGTPVSLDVPLRLTARAPSRTLHVVVGTEAFAQRSLGTPDAFALLPPYPNPSAGAVTLAFHLARSGPISLEVFDALGRRIARLAEDEREPGRYAVPWSPRDLASGLYVVRLISGDSVATRRFQIVR